MRWHRRPSNGLNPCHKYPFREHRRVTHHHLQLTQRAHRTEHQCHLRVDSLQMESHRPKPTHRTSLTNTRRSRQNRHRCPKSQKRKRKWRRRRVGGRRCQLQREDNVMVRWIGTSSSLLLHPRLRLMKPHQYHLYRRTSVLRRQAARVPLCLLRMSQWKSRPPTRSRRSVNAWTAVRWTMISVLPKRFL